MSKQSMIEESHTKSNIFKKNVKTANNSVMDRTLNYNDQSNNRLNSPSMLSFSAIANHQASGTNLTNLNTAHKSRVLSNDGTEQRLRNLKRDDDSAASQDVNYLMNIMNVNDSSINAKNGLFNTD